MLSVTRLLCGSPTPGDAIRYGEHPRHAGAIPSPGGAHHRPVVVWNITRRCNLGCTHCYTASTDDAAPDELTTAEAREVVRDLAGYRVPVILFSGGEPLMRADAFEMMALAAGAGVQPVLSSNGVLLTQDAVARLSEAGVKRAGISIDGLEATHDRFRRKAGAFREAMDGIRRCLAQGYRVSLRFTVTRANVADVDDIIALADREGIHRVCIYHLAYAGRGRGLVPDDLDNEQRRRMLDTIYRRTVEVNRHGRDLEVLTVDNHADGPYLLMWARENLPERLPEARRLLTTNGGNSSGKGIACIDERGRVHPDQFWRTRTVGNLRERPFSEIWSDETQPLLRQLRQRHHLLPEMCTQCRFLAVCNGNLRVRAEAATGDTWGEDPACYLTDAERKDHMGVMTG